MEVKIRLGLSIMIRCLENNPPIPSEGKQGLVEVVFVPSNSSFQDRINQVRTEIYVTFQIIW